MPQEHRPVQAIHQKEHPDVSLIENALYLYQDAQKAEQEARLLDGRHVEPSELEEFGY